METKVNKVPMKRGDIRSAFFKCTQLKRKSSETENQASSKAQKLTSVSQAQRDTNTESLVTNTTSPLTPNTLKPTSNTEEVKVKPVDTEDLKSNGQKPQVVEVDLSDEDDSAMEGGDASSCLTTSALDVSVVSSVNAEATSSMNASALGDISTDSDVQPMDTEINGATPNAVPTTSTPKRKHRRMTPEQAKLKEDQRAERLKEKELQKEQRLKLKEQKEAEKQKMKEEKEQQKKEKELQKLEQKKQRQEKKEQEEQRKQKEKEEKDKQKQLQLEHKQEEKRKKEELKLKALEEKKKLEEDKKAEEEKKKQLHTDKERAAFKSFFLKNTSPNSVPQVEQKEEELFRPFQVKTDMVLANIVPLAAKERFQRQCLEEHILAQDCEKLYLDLLKSGVYKSIQHKTGESKPLIDIEIVSDTLHPGLHVKAKLMQFCENIRPAYWGTWRKKSQTVKARHPFGQDTALDYEVDSEEEWDEGGPGESLTGTEDEESEDDYEVDNEFFVPHGYLSAEEEGEDENEPMDPEVLKNRLKMKEKEFLSQRKEKTTELKPIIFGCIYEGGDDTDFAAAEKFLKPYSVELLTVMEIPTTFNRSLGENCGIEAADKSSPIIDGHNQSFNNSRQSVPEEAIPYLIRLLHANTNSRNFVVREFQEFWLQRTQKLQNDVTDIELKENQTPPPSVSPNDSMNSLNSATPNKNSLKSGKISKRQLDKTVQSISTWCKCPHAAMKRFCWWVNEDILEKYNCKDVPVPNEWVYVHNKQSN